MAARGRDRRRRALQRHDRRESRRERQRSRKRFRRYAFGAIVGIGGVMIVLSLVIPASLGQVGRTAETSAEQGVEVSIQANEVVEPDQPHPAYSSSPPTSGWRYDIPLEEITWGSRAEEVIDEEQVSYLERGGIMVQYNCPEDCPGLVGQLESVVNRYPEGVVLAPNSAIDTTIALTAWGWIDTLEIFDDPRIDDFIQTYLGRGPSTFR